MKNNLPLPKDKKLTVICRIESGCLGPEGESHVQKFCGFAQDEVEVIDSDFVHWEIIPRHDKSESEMQYSVNNKKLSHKKAARYLEIFNKNLDEFEEHLHNKLTDLIDQFMKQ
jgi:hypothetical protein